MDEIILGIKTLLLMYAILGITMVSAASYLIYKIIKNLKGADE